MNTWQHILFGMVTVSSIFLSSCRKDYSPPTKWPDAYSIRVIDEDGHPIEKVFFVGGTETGRFHAPGVSPAENFSDRKGYAAPRTWGKPFLCATKKGYQCLDLRVDSIPTNETLTITLKRTERQEVLPKEKMETYL